MPLGYLTLHAPVQYETQVHHSRLVLALLSCDVRGNAMSSLACSDLHVLLKSRDSRHPLELQLAALNQRGMPSCRSGPTG